MTYGLRTPRCTPEITRLSPDDPQSRPPIGVQERLAIDVLLAAAKSSPDLPALAVSLAEAILKPDSTLSVEDESEAS